MSFFPFVGSIVPASTTELDFLGACVVDEEDEEDEEDGAGGISTAGAIVVDVGFMRGFFVAGLLSFTSSVLS